MKISEQLIHDIQRYIDDCFFVETEKLSLPIGAMPVCEIEQDFCAPCAGMVLDDVLHSLDESFSQFLLRKIDESLYASLF